MKKFSSLLLASLAVLAVAQSPTTEGTRGRGVAVAPESRIGNFRFEVVRASLNDRTRLVGGLTFFQVGRPAANVRPVEIRLENAVDLKVVDNKATFGGRAIMLVSTTNNQVRRIPGRLQVAVTDSRKPGDPSTGTAVDTFALRFVNPEANISFDFAGHVKEGDLAVFKK